ncbi:hypothetical protein PSHT_00081 [Puccinia striiformis]|uniref:2-dehydropantoate 2-reductase n=1 Tax=Puccinia striiformis TaxID=27350 RepID=A0A2S4WP56_9BASI|nr:hypothetical protein PSHT_00081 [Puccinia striiformis]
MKQLEQVPLEDSVDRDYRPEEGVKVSFVCRSNHEVVKREGIEIESSTLGKYRIKPDEGFKSIDHAATIGSSGNESRWDYVILCAIILPDLVDDPAFLSPLLKIPDTDRHPPTLVLIQNGVGFEDNLRRRHPKVPILSAVTIVNAEQLGPGLIRHNHWTRIKIHSHSQLELLAKLLRDGNINDAEIYGERDLQILRWRKLAINASMNPTSILSGGLQSTDMVKEGEPRVHLEGCVTEVFEAAKVIFGIDSFPSHFASIERILKSTEKAGQRSIIKPSMLVDWELGRPLEIGAISIMGIPIQVAARAGIKLSRIQSMYAFLTQLRPALIKPR